MKSWQPIATIADEVNAGKVKATKLVEQSLAAIEKHSEFNAVIATLAETARAQAKRVDETIARGKKAGRLAGVPFIAKDNMLVFGAETTAASNILKGFNAPYQATVINLLEAEGAICVAKANLDAFAHGSSTENSDFFTTLNPRDKTRVPGGSSGGSAAAVVLELAPFALGSDTGGSIRLPASFTGCVGYKPTYGLVSRSGVVAMGSSLDTIGPLTQTVEDAALVMEVIAGKDTLDSTTIARDTASYVVDESAEPLRGATFGVIKEYMGEGVEPGVRAQIQQAIEAISAAGGTITEVSLPSLPLGLAVYYVLCPAEVSSNLSRFDGQRYGHHTPDAADLHDSYTRTRQVGFGKEAKRRIMIGTYVLSSGYYDAYYKKAQTVRTKVINEFAEAFQKVDYLIGPTAPMTAFKIGANSEDPLQMYLTDIMTVSANLAGIPAISIPCGLSDGLPVGLQLYAAQKHDRQLLNCAAHVERLVA
ncbi:MAG: Asp-tRNA(Asn)/Glu-tRNA(Gln) amidotransferase subunit GatA [Candidatus Saccharimonadales bacterium]